MLSTKSNLVHQWSNGCFSCFLQTSLFKFVSGCADLLPPLLFVPYMKMLCSLASHPQAARHAFNLLKQNVVGNSVNVSWDHFFQSLNRYVVCGVFMSELWRYFSWGHSGSEVSYKCGSDFHWLWSCGCFLLWSQCTWMSIQRHIHMEVSVRILGKHFIWTQSKEITGTFIGSNMHKWSWCATSGYTFHSQLCQNGYPNKAVIWNFYLIDWYNTQTPSLMTSVEVLLNLVFIVL